MVDVRCNSRLYQEIVEIIGFIKYSNAGYSNSFVHKKGKLN